MSEVSAVIFPAGVQALRSRIPVWQQWVAGVLLFAFLFIGNQFVGVEITLGLLAAGLIGVLAVSSERFALYALILLTGLLQIKPGQDTKTFGPLDILAGATYAGLLIYWVIRYRFVLWQRLSQSRLTLSFNLYFLWAMIAGLIGIAAWENTFNDWVREILIQFLLFLVPLLFYRCVSSEKEQRQLIKVVLSMSSIMILVNFYKYAKNIVSAVYLYETGRAAIDPSGAMLVVFILFALASIQPTKKHWLLYLAGVGCATASVGISMYRTFWVATGSMLIMIIFLSQGEDRKRGKSFFLLYVATALAVLGVMYLTIPLFKLFVTMFINRFVSTSNVTTDPSLVNRYIEWASVWRVIKENPIVGQGYGSYFHTFNWLLGWHLSSGYTHNGFLQVFLKSGVVGLILFCTAYFGFIVKGFRIVRSPYLSTQERAIVRASLGYLLAIIVTTMTINAFNERGALLWLGLIWGYFLTLERKIRQESSSQITNKIELSTSK